MVPSSSDSQKRQTRIVVLTNELLEKCQDASTQARTRCKTIALELVELFKVEETSKRNPHN